MIGQGIITETSTTQFLPSDLPNLVAWFRFNLGQTVSQWTDQSGSGNHLLQASAPNQPTISAGTYIFDGIAQYLKCNAFTLNQPVTIYIQGRGITWVNNARFCDGDATNTGTIYQDTASPGMAIYAGSVLTTNNDLPVNTYGTICAVLNGVSSLLQINNGTPLSGDAGAFNLGGLTVGASGGPGSFGNVQFKEMAVYLGAHGAPNRTQVNNYMAGL